MRTVTSFGLLLRVLVMWFVAIAFGAFGTALLREGHWFIGPLLVVLGMAGFLGALWRLVQHLWKHRRWI